jgi:hypothetical protein
VTNCENADQVGTYPDAKRQRRKRLVAAAIAILAFVFIVMHIQRCDVLTNAGLSYSVSRILTLRKLESKDGCQLWALPASASAETEIKQIKKWCVTPLYYAVGQDMVFLYCQELQNKGGFFSAQDDSDMYLPVVWFGCDNIYIFYHQGVGAGI